MTELRTMRGHGFRTALLAPESSELARRGRDEGFAVHPLPFASKFDLASWRRLFATLRELRPTVVNTHSSEDSWMAGFAARILGVPLVLRTRHVLADISSAFSYNAFPHLVLACSRAIRDGLAAQGVRPGKIEIQPTGIDPERFRFKALDRAEVRREYGIADDQILVGNVGFLRIYKGQKFMVETAAHMDPHWRFMLVGGGHDHPLLVKLIRELGQGDRVILTGHQERPERFFSAFDLLFFPSFMSEGIAQSFIQGLYYGMPALVCRTPSILEPLRHVARHRVIDHGDHGAARAALLELSADLGRDEAAIQRQRRALAAEYGLEAMVANLLRIYALHGVRPPG